MTDATPMAPLHLQFICHEPLPSSHTNTEQIVKTAAALARQGADVHIVFPTRGAERLGEAAITAAIAEFYGIDPQASGRTLRFIQRPAPPIGNARRLWHDLTAVRFAHRAGGVLYVRDPVALVAALATGSSVVFETFRLDLSRRARYAVWRRLCLTHVNLVGIVTHSALAAEGLRRAGVAADRVIVAHNGVDIAAAHSTENVGEARTRLGCPVGQPLVVYAGHLNRRKGIDALLEMAAALPGFHFALVGVVPESADARWLDHQLRQCGASNVSTHARVAPNAVDAILRAADYLVIPPSAEPLENHHRTVLPMKTFRYLAAGRPIVAPDLPDVREVLRHEHNAVLVPPDAAAAATALARLAAEPALAARIAATAAADARGFTWDARAAKIIDFVRGRSGAAMR